MHDANLDANRATIEARKLLKEKALSRFEHPVELASGQTSEFFIDGKYGFSHGVDLSVACHSLHGLVTSAGIRYDAVGGLTLGADHLSIGIALVAGTSWFIVRKATKDHGTGRRIEGARIGPGMRVLIVEDVVSTGGSMLQAVDAAIDEGAEVVAVATLVDRGERARKILAERKIPYFPLATYADLGIPPLDA